MRFGGGPRCPPRPRVALDARLLCESRHRAIDQLGESRAGTHAHRNDCARGKRLILSDLRDASRAEVAQRVEVLGLDCQVLEFGAPGRIRTHDPLVRRLQPHVEAGAALGVERPDACGVSAQADGARRANARRPWRNPQPAAADSPAASAPRASIRSAPRSRPTPAPTRYCAPSRYARHAAAIV